MDREQQLRAYTLQIVAFGQAALATYRRGERLPDELAALAEDLLVLEANLGTAAAAEPDRSVEEPQEAPEERPAALDEAPAVDRVAAGPDADADLAPLFVTVPPDGDEPPAAGVVASPPATDDVIVLDVDQEPGGGPAAVETALEALPALVIDVARDLPPESPAEAPPAAEEPAAPDGPALVGAGAPTVFASGAVVWPAAEAATLAGQPPAATETPGETPTAGEQFCANCGERLRPGRRFCQRCGAPVVAAAAAAPPAPAPTPLSEMPTIIGGPYHSESAPPAAATGVSDDAPARFCNNCGRGVAAGLTICPECGSRDIS